MSVQLINHSPDLKQLRDEGYSVYVKGGILIIEDIPYLNSQKEVLTGTILSKLRLSGEKAVYSNDHVVFFIGTQPCNNNGTVINMIHQSINTNHGNEIISNMSFSSKPSSGYKDYYHKMVTYINIISAPASSIDESVTPKKYKAITDEEGLSSFNYIDTNSSRASIDSISNKLVDYKIGIIGLGGTGSYILDFVAKTPVKEIHLFDGDDFLTHNAFRTPGAPSIDELNSGISKVNHLKSIYSKMHRNINAHCYYMSDEHLSYLSGLNFVFISIDEGRVKADIFEFLEQNNIPYIDVGMGLDIVDGALRGMVRTTSITKESRRDLKDSISMLNAEDDAYSSNIQIAELNALNASMAVISWKQHAGFYHDIYGTGQSMFTIDTLNNIRTEDAA